MLVLNRFRVDEAETDVFRSRIEEALAVLAEQKGFLDGRIGRNVDEPGLWVLSTRWSDVGSYRRALSSYDVKLRGWALLGTAIEEPSAYELVEPGQLLNDVRPREIR